MSACFFEKHNYYHCRYSYFYGPEKVVLPNIMITWIMPFIFVSFTSSTAWRSIKCYAVYQNPLALITDSFIALKKSKKICSRRIKRFLDIFLYILFLPFSQNLKSKVIYFCRARFIFCRLRNSALLYSFTKIRYLNSSFNSLFPIFYCHENGFQLDESATSKQQ